MIRNVLEFFRSIYRPLATAGVHPSLSSEERKTVLLMNQVLLMAAVINLAGVVIYFINGLYLSAFVNLVTGGIFMTGIYFNHHRHYRLSRIICVGNINHYLIVINIAEGLGAGEYLLYFPVFISVTFMVRIYKDYSELVFTYVFTAVAAFVCIEFIPHRTNFQWISDATMHEIFASRLILAILITIYVSYLALRISRDNEQSLLEEKRFSEAIYNSSMHGIFIVNGNTGIVHDCNLQTLQLFDFDNKYDIIGTPISKWLEEKNISSLLNKSDKNDGWQGELTVRTQKGRVFYGFCSAVLFTYRDIQYIKIGILDITNVKSAEFELMKAKEKAESAAKMKTRFLSNMSHELRTPLNGIIGTTNLMMQEEFLPNQRAHLDVLKYSSEHMLTLVNDILDHTKMEAGKMELALAPFNMMGFMQKIINQFQSQAEAKGLQFKTEVDLSLDVDLLTDETRLHQVLGNLLSNAIKFTHKGQVSLSARKIMASSSQFTVQFEVSDTGIGIPLNKRNEVFESFTQANVETTR
ncbi:MAG TPA: histidine kinase dimerization/phospho-acceptor domain-containing protein, partial [Chitinophagaceae bacterium]|nr:histidine kinase dimerization/phospho-acceptor domain-containing protein [Chitinophagaceae bacterium]